MMRPLPGQTGYLRVDLFVARIGAVREGYERERRIADILGKLAPPIGQMNSRLS